MNPLIIRTIEPADFAKLALVGGRAFAPQPLTEWLFGSGEDSAQRGAMLIRIELKKAHAHKLVFTTESLHGLALWYPPGVKPRDMSLVSLWQMVPAIRLDLRKVPAQLRLFSQVEKAHPRQPHYYLRLLAVDPPFQGQGIGKALMQPVLELCDQQGAPAYLETDTGDNVRFYQRRGFAVKQEIPVSGTSHKLWTMWREGR